MDKLSMELDEAHDVVTVRFEAKIAYGDLEAQTAAQIAAGLRRRIDEAAIDLIAGFQENAKKG